LGKVSGAVEEERRSVLPSADTTRWRLSQACGRRAVRREGVRRLCRPAWRTTVPTQP